MRFEPAGMTDDPDIRIASSLMDYLFRRLALEYLSYEERAELGILTIAERTAAHAAGRGEAVIETPSGRSRRRSAVRCRRLRLAAGRRAPAPRRSSAARTPEAAHLERRPVVHAVRRADAAGRQLPRLPELRHHQRLQLTSVRPRMCWAPLGYRRVAKPSVCRTRMTSRQ